MWQEKTLDDALAKSCFGGCERGNVSDNFVKFRENRTFAFAVARLIPIRRGGQCVFEPIVALKTWKRIKWHEADNRCMPRWFAQT